MKLVPLGDRVVLKQLEAEETTKSGIVLPGQNKEKPQQAEVIAVGPGTVVDGKEVKMEVKVEHLLATRMPKKRAKKKQPKFNQKTTKATTRIQPKFNQKDNQKTTRKQPRP